MSLTHSRLALDLVVAQYLLPLLLRMGLLTQLKKHNIY